jgi:hypothetical protein
MIFLSFKRSWGQSIRLAPVAWAFPHIAITSHKVNRPLGCLPLWGREGVTFVFFSQRKDKQIQVFYRAPFFIVNS